MWENKVKKSRKLNASPSTNDVLTPLTPVSSIWRVVPVVTARLPHSSHFPNSSTSAEHKRMGKQQYHHPKDLRTSLHWLSKKNMITWCKLKRFIKFMVDQLSTIRCNEVYGAWRWVWTVQAYRTLRKFWQRSGAERSVAERSCQFLSLFICAVCVFCILFSLCAHSQYIRKMYARYFTNWHLFTLKNTKNTKN